MSECTSLVRHVLVVGVDLVEVKPDAAARGSGITLQGNALRVLSQLGVWPEIEANGFGFDKTGMRAPDRGVIMMMPGARMRGPDFPATGRLLRAGVTKVWGPGRHLAGNDTFSYFLDPHGNTMEYTTELELLDEDTWHPHLYDFTDPHVSDQWGTANKPDELLGKASFNDPDKGAFVAPPV